MFAHVGPRGRCGVAQGLGHLRIDAVIGMAEQYGAEAQCGIDVALALVIPQVRAFAVADEQGLTVECRQDTGGAGNIAYEIAHEYLCVMVRSRADGGSGSAGRISSPQRVFHGLLASFCSRKSRNTRIRGLRCLRLV
ncbi:hypothetical protein D3C79_806690 [compost metagenome]